MLLTNLLKNVEKYMMIGNDINIRHLSHCSSLCVKDTLFFAIDGTKEDGAKYVEEAIECGAIAVVTNKRLKVNIAQIIVDDVRETMSLIAKAFYHNASDKLKIIGIVGTNGKTTSSFIIKNILTFAGFTVGVVGTNGVYIDNNRISEDLTTPDPIDLHKYLDIMKKAKVDYVIMEVSAHAIDLKKIKGIRFKVGLYTNISNEHLDYFGTMKNYTKCKLSFFNNDIVDEAVYNIDDDYGVELARNYNVPNITYGLDSPSNTFAIDIVESIDGTKFIVNSLDSIFKIDTKLLGKHNVYNILGAMSVCKLLNINDKYIELGVNTIDKIDGRCNVIRVNNNYVIIDFAHTPDGFEKILSTIRGVCKGKVITLFGCVGYSDTRKRSIMGNVASRYSDYIILTSDNPGDTDIKKINRDIKSGFKKYKNYIEIDDRRDAIKYGLGLLCSSDVLVLLGKGGEHKQIIMNEIFKYNEEEVVNNLING